MSKSIKYDPSSDMSPKLKKRFAARQEDLMTMPDEDIEKVIAKASKNPEKQAELIAVLVRLVRALG